jgi:hypothetical protein
VAFGRHFHLILILLIFSWRCLKDKVDSSNPRMEEVKENIFREIANICAEHLQRVNQNPFCQCEECLLVEGQHFRHYLWFVNGNNLNLNIFGQKAYWFVGKIHIRLAAGGTPVAVMGSDMNRSTKARTFLYIWKQLLWKSVNYSENL